MSRNHYYLYIDDHGSRKPDHEPDPRDDGMNCFAFGGILVHESDIDAVVTGHKQFCTNWEIVYPLHSSDIRGMRENFRWLQDSTKDSQRFHKELNEYITSLPVIGFAAVVSRPGYNARYRDTYGSNRWKLCKTAYNILVERVTKFVESNDATFEVFFEQSGKKEDRTLKQYARELKSNGHPFNSTTSSKYTPLGHEVFRRRMLGEPRERTKKCIFTQLADLYLYPMVKRRYDPAYRAWIEIFEAKKVVDALLSEQDWEMLGIKYSCFDTIELIAGSKNPETSSG